MPASERQRLNAINFDKAIARSIQRSIKNNQRELAWVTEKINALIAEHQAIADKRALEGTREASAFGQAFVKGIFQHATVMHSTFGFLMQI